MKKIILIISILILTTFSSCSLKNLTPSELLRPPITSEKIREIEKDIEEGISQKTYPLYPKDGSYRNSIILQDLNGDKQDEVISTYTLSSDNPVPNVLIMKSENNKYVVDKIIEGSGIGIDYIDFIDFNNDGTMEICVGWLLAKTEFKGTSVYDISKTTTELLTTPYNSIKFIQTETGEKYIFSTNLLAKNTPAVARIFGYENDKIREISSCEMNGSIQSYVSILSEISQDSINIIVNENIDASFISSEIITFSNKKLINHTFVDGKLKFHDILMRAGTIYAQDIDDDKAIEFPVNINLNFKDTISKKYLRVSQWYNFKDGSFTHKMYTVLNPSERYYLIYPEKWVTLVTPTISTNNSSFYVKTIDGNEELLFSIFVFPKKEYEIKKANAEYSPIYEVDDMVYTLYLPTVTTEIAKSTQPKIEDIKKMFVYKSIKQR